MKKSLPIVLVLLLSLGTAVMAQELTLDQGQPVNTQIQADTLADGSQAHSLYKVESGGFYAFDGTVEVDFDLVIEGPDNGWIFEDPNPPVFVQLVSAEGAARDMINLNEGGSATLKNILLSGLINGAEGTINISSFVRNLGGYKIVWDNCVFTDHRDHATRSTAATTEITITNCVFINMDRRGSSPFGGMPFRLDAECLQLTFENNTIVNGSRLFGNGGNFFTSRITEIHNTILNQQVNGHEIHWFEGLQANNIYYNWSWRGRNLRTNGYEAPFTTFETFSGVATKLDSISLYEGSNAFYLDPRFPEYWENTINPMVLDDSSKVIQCFLWNVDVDSTINADDNFTIGKNYWQIDPEFTVDPSQVDSMLQWCYWNWISPDSGVTDPMDRYADWRVTPPITWNPDGSFTKNWPPDWDLTYSNSALRTAGTDGLPLGDLNWYPSAKADYLANRDGYIAALRDSMTNATYLYIPGDSLSAFITADDITSVNSGAIPAAFRLDQNYPNPFNPKTTIEYSVGQAGVIKIELFNTLGQKVKTLFDGQRLVGEYKLTVDGSDLTSGLYFYSISAGDFSQTRKMILLK